MKTIYTAAITFIAVLAFALPVSTQPQATAGDAMAKEATIYGYALVDNYRAFYELAIDDKGSQFKAPIGQIKNVNRLAGPKDTAVQTINADTPYSYLWLDLRTEHYVLSMPKIEPNRYYSIQLVDLYTHNLDYIGTRRDGNDGGDFLIAGPSWKGETPKGIKRVITVETEFMQAIYRTQLFNPADIENVKKIQAGYLVRPLSQYLGQRAAPPAMNVNFPPIDRVSMAEPDKFFGYLNFVLEFCPVHPSEQQLRQRVAKIDIAPGRAFSLAALPADLRAAVLAGFKAGIDELNQATANTRSSIGLFGTRAFLQNDYLKRAIGAKIGLYGNSVEETVYLGWQKDDASGGALDTGKHKYVVRFAKDGLPPARAFWSITMYDGKTLFMVENPLKRYLVNSPMLPVLKRDPDGGITIYVQRDSPEPEKESNWLPAPNGPLFAVLRIYLPEPQVQAGQWQQPPMQRVE